MQQQVMWTALPAGRSEDGLRVSVAVTPLLDPEQPTGDLAMFPDFLDWPATEIEWHVAIGDAAPVSATSLGDPPDSTLWTALFSGDTLVRPPEHPDYTDHLWWSYPVGHIVDFVRTLYQEVATTWPTEHPEVDWLLDPNLGLRPLAHLAPDGADLRRSRVRDLEGLVRDQRALPPGPAHPELDFLQLWRFHKPAPLGERPEQPSFDFHQAVALISEHPGLARRLGLVHDLLVPGTFAAGSTTVRVEPTWAPEAGADSSDALPTTTCRISAAAFLPEPHDPGELTRGRLPLGTGPYEIVQVDPDGAALKLLQYARNLVLSRLRISEDTPDHEALPSLESAGFAVARTGHAPVVRARVVSGFDLHSARAAGQPILLHAEDVTRGYRFDLWTSVTGQWHSLQERVGDYEFLSLPAQDKLVEITEEGFVVEVPTDRSDEQDPDSLYLQESLMRWEGWSLAAPRPGRTLLENDEVADAPAGPTEGFPLVMHFKAKPKSLPRLRFGETYRLRARAVDIAGNSVPFDDDDSEATDERTYLRFEPVAAPVALLAAPRTEGETVERVVLRSNYDTDPHPGTAQRHLAPPAVTQRTAEEHGKYDTAAGVDPGAYAAIVGREAKTFNDVGVIDEQQHPEAFRLPYFPEIPLEVPYLPDPMARGVALYGLPGGSQTGDFAGFDHAAGWPESRPLRLVVEEGNGAPQLTEAAGERVLTVQLPKAEIVEVRVSCHLDPDDLELSGIWRWIVSKPGVTQQQIDHWRALAGRGLMWMLTPYRTLTLVHATRQPLEAPVIQGLGNAREAGDTFTDLDGSISLHRGSTSRVDLHATWSEPVDEGHGGGAPAPDPFDREHHQVLVVPERGEGPANPGAMDFVLRQEFGDTKHRRITYEAEATSTFTEYFVLRDRVVLADGEAVVLDGVEHGIVEGSEVVSRDGDRFTRDVDYTIDYEEAVLSLLDGGGIPDGAEVDVEYLPGPISRFSEDTVTLEIPGSARPPSPTVLYAIPTHKWSRGGSFLELTSDGLGGGLRIYLDRPLMQSGEGELLGVLLDPNPEDPDEGLAPYVTRWGFDPVQVTPPLPHAAPKISDFALRTASGSDLVLDENGAAVDVAGHQIQFDEERKLWFCDIEVDAGSAHWPFIRLALASYQPTSIAGKHLSRVVLADFVQLTSDRFATLAVDPRGRFVDVSVVGSSAVIGHAGSDETLMAVEIERREGPAGDDALGWEPVPGQPTVLAAERDPSGSTRWTGSVSLPPTRERRDEAFRLVIEEFAVGPQARAGGQGSATGRDAGGERGPGPRDVDGERDSGGGRGPGRSQPVPVPFPNVGSSSGTARTRRLLYRDIVPLDLQERR